MVGFCDLLVACLWLLRVFGCCVDCCVCLYCLRLIVTSLGDGLFLLLWLVCVTRYMVGCSSLALFAYLLVCVFVV